MLKFLLIIFLISYLFFRVGGFLFRTFFLGATQQRQPGYQRQSRPAPNSNVNIDFKPNQSKNKKSDFKGGEYVDYEDVS